MTTDTLHIPPEIDAALEALERGMPQLQANAGGMFELACGWAERHDAVLAITPPALQPIVRARLRRIGIRWGMVSGARVTTQFPIGIAPPAGLRRKYDPDPDAG
ncbi:hypothetical protein [Cognatilysobacter tabacisoli]|uniref:hypothetical protein n=1 Tax=Cognatilysobacter tabacisoli TaxID=2315424 RepID=UPI000E6B0A50|nr:hypothetical protein [Lysobacter tabacisoli]